MSDKISKCEPGPASLADPSKKSAFLTLPYKSLFAASGLKMQRRRVLGSTPVYVLQFEGSVTTGVNWRRHPEIAIFVPGGSRFRRFRGAL